MVAKKALFVVSSAAVLLLISLFSIFIITAEAHYELLPHKWPDHIVNYEINPARAPTCALDAIKRAAKQWTDVNCSCFTPTCVNQSSDRWAGEKDSHNVISFCNRTHTTIDGQNGTLAVTHIWYFKNCTVSETDIHFDAAELWNCTTGCKAPEFHLETVAKHEFGHVAGLDDLYDPAYKDEIMYGYIDECQVKHLTENDKEGIRKLYPSPHGGYSLPISKPNLDLSPLCISSTSIILVSTIVTAIYVKRVKRRRENQ